MRGGVRRTLGVALTLILVLIMRMTAWGEENEDNVVFWPEAEANDPTLDDLMEKLQTAAENGTVVKLSQDFIHTGGDIFLHRGEQGKPVILDLNGYTLTSNGILYVSGDIQIQDKGSTGKEGSIISTASTKALVLYQTGVLTIESGSISAPNTQVAIYTQGTGNRTIRITGGTVTSKGYTIFLQKDSDLTITGGEVTSENSSAIAMTGTGTIRIEGGTVTSKALPPENTECSTIVTQTSTNSIEITGGTIESENSTAIKLQDNTTFDMSGGEVIGNAYGIALWDDCKVTVKGDAVIRANIPLSGNGTSIERHTKLNIEGGTIEGVIAGIYHPQNGTLNITGGNIFAKEGLGIVVRGGTVNIDGDAVITAQGDGTKIQATIHVEPNCPTGTAVFADCSTENYLAGPVTINLKKGTLNGAYASFIHSIRKGKEEAGDGIFANAEIVLKDNTSVEASAIKSPTDFLVTDTNTLTFAGKWVVKGSSATPTIITITQKTDSTYTLSGTGTVAIKGGKGEVTLTGNDLTLDTSEGTITTTEEKNITLGNWTLTPATNLIIKENNDGQLTVDKGTFTVEKGGVTIPATGFTLNDADEAVLTGIPNNSNFKGWNLPNAVTMTINGANVTFTTTSESTFTGVTDFEGLTMTGTSLTIDTATNKTTIDSGTLTHANWTATGDISVESGTDFEGDAFKLTGTGDFRFATTLAVTITDDEAYIAISKTDANKFKLHSAPAPAERQKITVGNWTLTPSTVDLTIQNSNGQLTATGGTFAVAKAGVTGTISATGFTWKGANEVALSGITTENNFKGWNLPSAVTMTTDGAKVTFTTAGTAFTGVNVFEGLSLTGDTASLTVDSGAGNSKTKIESGTLSKTGWTASAGISVEPGTDFDGDALKLTGTGNFQLATTPALTVTMTDGDAYVAISKANANKLKLHSAGTATVPTGLTLMIPSGATWGGDFAIDMSAETGGKDLIIDNGILVAKNQDTAAPSGSGSLKLLKAKSITDGNSGIPTITLSNISYTNYRVLGLVDNGSIIINARYNTPKPSTEPEPEKPTSGPGTNESTTEADTDESGTSESTTGSDTNGSSTDESTTDSNTDGSGTGESTTDEPTLPPASDVEEEIPLEDLSWDSISNPNNENNPTNENHYVGSGVLVKRDDANDDVAKVLDIIDGTTATEEEKAEKIEVTQATQEMIPTSTADDAEAPKVEVLVNATGQGETEGAHQEAKSINEIKALVTEGSTGEDSTIAPETAEAISEALEMVADLIKPDENSGDGETPAPAEEFKASAVFTIEAAEGDKEPEKPAVIIVEANTDYTPANTAISTNRGQRVAISKPPSSYAITASNTVTVNGQEKSITATTYDVFSIIIRGHQSFKTPIPNPEVTGLVADIVQAIGGRINDEFEQFFLAIPKGNSEISSIRVAADGDDKIIQTKSNFIVVGNGGLNVISSAPSKECEVEQGNEQVFHVEWASKFKNCDPAAIDWIITMPDRTQRFQKDISTAKKKFDELGEFTVTVTGYKDGKDANGNPVEGTATAGVAFPKITVVQPADNGNTGDEGNKNPGAPNDGGCTSGFAALTLVVIAPMFLKKR